MKKNKKMPLLKPTINSKFGVQEVDSADCVHFFITHRPSGTCKDFWVSKDSVRDFLKDMKCPELCEEKPCPHINWKHPHIEQSLQRFAEELLMQGIIA